MRYMVIITNLLLWLAGIGVLAVSIWLYSDSAHYLSLSADSYMYHTAIFILIGAGAVMTIVGFIGCCGALRESQCMLGIYFVLLLVIFAAELTGGVWAYLHKDELKSAVTKYVNNMVREQYYKDPVANKTVDAMQHDLLCCGAEGPSDWGHATRTKPGEEKGLIEMGIDAISAKAGFHEVPRSCCVKMEDVEDCDRYRSFKALGDVANKIHTKGCVDALKVYIDEHLLILIGVAIGIAAAQILALVFSIVLCCGIRDSDVPYKA